MADKLTKNERAALECIDATDGGEFTSHERIFDTLRTRGLLHFSGKRGPGNAWYRITLTAAGQTALEEARRG